MKAIWPKGLLKEKNIHVAYKYTLVPDKVTELSVVASNLYRLFINGEFVGYGPARAAHGFSRVDTYSLSPWAGDSAVIVVEVYSSNVNSFYTVDEPPFFAAEIKNGDEKITDAAGFIAYLLHERVQKVRRFSYQRTFVESYCMTDNLKNFFTSPHSEKRTSVETEGVAMNKLLPRYVSYPELQKSDAQVIEHGEVSVCGNGTPWLDRAYTDVDGSSYKGFAPSEIEQDVTEYINCLEFRAREGVFPKKTDGMKYRTYDFTRTLTGFFSFDAVVSEKSVLYIIFDEVATEKDGHKEIFPFRNTCCNIIKFELEPGEYNLLSFEANSARFASVIVTQGCVEIADFGMVLYENPDAENYKYDYQDDELNEIVAAAINTFSQNAVDVLTDCPSRERAGWLCDSYFSSRAERLFTGKTVVEKSFLENYAMCPQLPGLPEGMLPMCYPADVYNGLHIPNWSMWYIIELWEYVKYTGDERMRNISQDKVKGLVEFFKKYENSDGLLENLENWVFVEWSKCNDSEYISGVNYPSNMLWAQALCAAAELYDMPELKVKAAAMRKTISEKAWNGTFFEENALRNERGKLIKTGHTTETCQYYAFFFGVATRQTHPELFERMLKEFGPNRDQNTTWPMVYPSNAFIGNYLRLEILLRYGYYEQILRECRDYFLKMARLTGTLWEHAKVDASLNHGFASVVAVYIDECAKRLKNQ